MRPLCPRRDLRRRDLRSHADPGLSARHSPEQEKRRIDGKEYVDPDQLAWPGIATLPGLPLTAIPTGFAPDGVQIVGPWLAGPDAAEAGRTDRARIRTFRSTKEV
jgi:hypothetical protein